MKYKTFSSDIWNQINKTLDTVLQQESAPVAAFDADGTLWDTDLGESFFDYLIDNKCVPLPADPWRTYETLKKDPAGPEIAYLWLAQIMKGVPVIQAQEWAAACVHGMHPLPVFSEQQKLIDLFLKKGVKVFVVTASVKWAVEPGAKALGLPFEQVLGIETEIEKGILTDRQKGLITYRTGKPAALLEKTKGQRPFFCSGNTSGDTALLESAKNLRLAVSATHPDDRIFRTEQELLNEATARGWLHHRFV